MPSTYILGCRVVDPHFFFAVPDPDPAISKNAAPLRIRIRILHQKSSSLSHAAVLCFFCQKFCYSCWDEYLKESEPSSITITAQHSSTVTVFVTSLMWESSFVCLIVLLLSERELKNFKYLSLEPIISPDSQRIRIRFF